MTAKELREFLEGCSDDTRIEIGLRSYERGKLRSVSYHGDVDFQRFYGKTCVLLIDDPHKEKTGIPDDDFHASLQPIVKDCIGSDYASSLINDDRFYSDVKHNVEETSAWFDEGFYTDDDIRLAIGRVLLERLSIDYE
ncbi:MAG: hypothetical protein IJ640_02605 [Prevotella sp.]|nr:hypothetical protein [Prevotella sp.]